ncbi:ATP-binding protein [Nannocystis sp.]|uniref:hybrid sensor histidine kinase/response regulator n=1 Tax=Nannocystis sp. TaxID=1962667 RepID=UPI002429178B|nr:ATP-binding protein [Nannocystis sp.]MBK7826355.1 response regulator [Nannocystis sp.]MBK9757872.1 response regulator [Nannocystis sp.]
MVEDNLALAENIAELLRDEGVRVVMCGTGAEALKAVDAGIDLAIVDVRLPDLTGVRLVPQLRKRMPEGEVILMTGDGSLDTAIAAVREGVFAYVQKPFSPQDLLALAVRALAQVQLRRERARLAAELAVSERMYRGVVETVESLIVSLDRSGAIQMWNHCVAATTGWALDEVVGHDFVATVVAPEHRAACEKLLVAAWRDRRLVDRECVVQTRDGRRREVRWSIVAFAPEGESRELLLLVGSDVTDRRVLEKRAADAEAMASLATLTAGLAHEIRNPLNAALLQLELLTRISARISGESERARIGECAHLVQSEIRRLSRLLEEFLGLARPRTLERTPVDVKALCEYVCRTQQPVAETAGVALRLDLPPRLPQVMGDPPKLTQVLVNLVVNAIDAMREAELHGEIVIAGEQIGERVCIRVVDQGPGVDERVAGEIFRPFVSTKATGTGLGLTIAKKIIEQHGGTVELVRLPGGGTAARIELPTVPVGATEDRADLSSP